MKPEWRNWQTQRTQNPSRFTPREGSTPSSGTTIAARSILIASLVFCLSSLALPARGIEFEASFDAFATGAGPRGVALGKIDADDVLDCVTANWSSSGATGSMLRGLEGGGFAPAAAVPLEGLDIALADLDADAALDAVVALGGFGVAVWRGDGAGGFSFATSYALGGLIWRVWLAPVDADAVLDLLVLDIDSHTSATRVGVLLGLGEAAFAPVQWTSPVFAFRDAALGDANGDGHLDVFIPGVAGTGGVSVFFGAGDGSFPQQVILPFEGSGSGVAMGRFDTHAGLDLAMNYATAFGDRIAIWTADTAGGFIRQPDAIPQEAAWRLATADLDADGDDDLIALGARLGILRARGDGTLEPARPYDAGVEPWSVATGDLNADGRLDLVVAANGSGCIAALHGRADFHFGHPRIVSTAALPQAVAAADFDADGRADVALTSPVSDAIAVHRNLGNGTFANRIEVAVAREPAGLASGDVDANGVPDLVTATFFPENANAVCVLRGLGALQFAARQDAAIPGPATSVLLADLDADGDDDVITTLWTRDYPVDGEIAVLLSRGDGTLELPRCFDVGPLPWSAASGDLDADGFLDLAVSFRVNSLGSEGGVTLLFGVGDGGFERRRDLTTGVEPRGVVLADVDGDMLLDLAVAHSAFASEAAPAVLVLRGDGNGGFDPHVDLSAGLEPHAVVAADFDADGFMDLASANASGWTVSVFPGRGPAGFAPRIDLGAGARPRMLAVSDVGGDPLPDLVVANEFGASASVLLNRSAPTPVLFESISAQRVAAGVELRWSTAAGVTAVDVERAATAAGPFIRRNAQPVEVAFFHDSLAADAAAWYRLRALPAGGTTAPIHVAATAAGSVIAITHAVEAADGTFRFGISLRAPATRLAIHDVAGRVLAALPHTGLGRGEHLLGWDGRTAGGRPAPRGIYWLRVEAGGVHAARRVVRLRP